MRNELGNGTILSIALVNPPFSALLPDKLNRNALNVGFETDWDEGGWFFGRFLLAAGWPLSFRRRLPR